MLDIILVFDPACKMPMELLILELKTMNKRVNRLQGASNIIVGIIMENYGCKAFAGISRNLLRYTDLQ